MSLITNLQHCSTSGLPGSDTAFVSAASSLESRTPRSDLRKLLQLNPERLAWLRDDSLILFMLKQLDSYKQNDYIKADTTLWHSQTRHQVVWVCVYFHTRGPVWDYNCSLCPDWDITVRFDIISLFCSAPDGRSTTLYFWGNGWIWIKCCRLRCLLAL